MPLEEYIQKYFEGNKSAFASHCGVKPQQITQWINKGFIVVEHQLYSPRRELPKATN